MNDQQASVTVEAMLELAVTVRDDGPDAVARAVSRVLAASGGDTASALVVAAALIRVDEPVDAWWQRGLAGVGAKVPASARYRPCGTHAAYERHRVAGETACPACLDAESEYHSARRAARKAAA